MRFDDTEVPGLRPTVAYIDGRTTRPTELAKLISEKLGPRVGEKFFPPEPDKLFEALNATTLEVRDSVERIARSFMQTLIRMTVDERKLVAHLFVEGCRTQLPNNVHVSLDIVRRDLGIAPSEVIERIRAMTSLGFEQEIRPDADHGGDVLVVRWVDTMRYDDGLTEELSLERATEIAVRMLDVGAGDEGCKRCAEQCLEALDFSLLVSSTSKP